MLHVILPVTFIGGPSLGVDEDAIPIGLIILPFSLIVVAIGMRELPLSFRLVVTPLSLVYGSIRPFLPASTVPYVTKPLSFILYPVFKSLQRFFLSLDATNRLRLL